MQRGEVWRRSASLRLVVSSTLYHHTFPDRVVVVRVIEGDPNKAHPYSVAITDPVAGFVLPDLIEYIDAGALGAGTLLGRIGSEATAAVDRILRGVLELP